MFDIKVNATEILALHTSDQAPLRQIGTLLKELLDGKRSPQDESWRFLPTLLKSIINDPVQSKHFETSAPNLFMTAKSKINE